MNATEILFRCSSLGHIMTEPRGKNELLSESCKTHLVDVFVSKKYGRSSDITNKYVNKGMMVEEDSMTLYSRFKKEFFIKNKEWFSNEFISGTPDIIKDDLVIDIKSSWDIYTFFRASQDKLNSKYYWQLMGYMALTGCKVSKLSYCLVNTPDILINDEKRKMMWKMGVIDDSNELYQEVCKEIELLCIYDDIDMSERVNEIEILRDDEAIERIYKRVSDCRDFMNKNLFKL